LTFGLYFIVQDPSGYIVLSMAKFCSLRRTKWAEGLRLGHLGQPRGLGSGRRAVERLGVDLRDVAGGQGRAAATRGAALEDERFGEREGLRTLSGHREAPGAVEGRM
jgi:hypothetical protein